MTNEFIELGKENNHEWQNTLSYENGKLYLEENGKKHLISGYHEIIYSRPKNITFDRAYSAYQVQKKKNDTFGAYIDRIKAKGYSVL
jgi:hypothetical protein